MKNGAVNPDRPYIVRTSPPQIQDDLACQSRIPTCPTLTVPSKDSAAAYAFDRLGSSCPNIISRATPYGAQYEVVDCRPRPSQAVETRAFTAGHSPTAPVFRTGPRPASAAEAC